MAIRISKLIDYKNLSMMASESYKNLLVKYENFEPLFWPTLLALTLMTYMSEMMQAHAAAVGAAFQSIPGIVVIPLALILGLGFILLFALLVLPYWMAVIRHSALGEKPGTHYLQELLRQDQIPTLVQLLKLTLMLAGFAIVILIPGILSTLLISLGSTSNILTTFSSLLYLMGFVVLIYAMLRVMPAMVMIILGQELDIAVAFEKSKGHVLSVIFLIALMAIPVMLIMMLLSTTIEQVAAVYQGTFLFYVIELLRSLVTSIGILLNLYLVWGALTEYMLKQKIITVKKAK